jgi:regulator of nucleoside diphosphate kinase
MTVAAHDRPPVTLSVTDHRRLMAAALDTLQQAPRLAAGLLEELERAAVVPDEALPEGVAGLGSWVEFREGAAAARRAQLVLQPVEGESLPVLSPPGAALIGLRAGQSIRWPDRLGSNSDLTLLAVQPRELPPVDLPVLSRELGTGFARR